MKRLLLALGLLLAPTLAAAQCIAVGGVNTVPQPGVNCLSEPSVATFGATGIGLVPAASATDIACLPGNASNVVRIQRVTISGTAGTLVNVPITLLKRASANTGGTPATSTALPVAYRFDANSAAPVSVPIAWTANPTIVDTTPGILAHRVVNFGTTGTTVATANGIFDWLGRNYMAAIILRGVAQNLCVNLNTTSISSGVLGVSFTWTEAAQ